MQFAFHAGLILIVVSCVPRAEAQHVPSCGEKTCRVVGTSPFCTGSCTACHRDEICIADTQHGPPCWTGSKVLCCTLLDSSDFAAAMTHTLPISSAVAEGFDPAAIAKCIADKLDISVSKALGCVMKCKLSPTCYPGCLDLSAWKVLKAVGSCLLSGADATTLASFDEHTLALLEKQHGGEASPAWAGGHSVVTFSFPSFPEISIASSGGSTTGFSVSSVGTGSFTGLSYTVPAFTKGTIKAKIQVMALTSTDMANLNSLIGSMLSASVKTKVTSYKHVHASADLSFFGFFCGGGGASYDKTDTSMRSSGLTTAQITTIVDKLLEAAQQMSHVELDFLVDNSANDFSVSGDLQLYTIAGNVTTSKGTHQYRMLADQGTAGQPGSTAPASGKVIPLK